MIPFVFKKLSNSRPSHSNRKYEMQILLVSKVEWEKKGELREGRDIGVITDANVSIYKD